MQIAADHVFSHLVVFTSPARDSIAIEPISHANNAVNLAARRDRTGPGLGLDVGPDVGPDVGLRVLAPGETLSGAFTMTPVPLETKR